MQPFFTIGVEQAAALVELLNVQRRAYCRLVCFHTNDVPRLTAHSALCESVGNAIDDLTSLDKRPGTERRLTPSEVAVLEHMVKTSRFCANRSEKDGDYLACLSLAVSGFCYMGGQINDGKDVYFFPLPAANRALRDREKGPGSRRLCTTTFPANWRDWRDVGPSKGLWYHPDAKEDLTQREANSRRYNCPNCRAAWAMQDLAQPITDERALAFRRDHGIGSEEELSVKGETHA